MFSFLAVAEDLKIRGLTQSSSSSHSESQAKISDSTQRKRRRSASGGRAMKEEEEEEEEVQEIPNIKTETHVSAGSLTHYQGEVVDYNQEYNQDYHQEYEEGGQPDLTTVNTELQQEKLGGEIPLHLSTEILPQYPTKLLYTI